MKKIAIVGAHRATKLQAPYEDKEWEIWSSSPSNESELPRHDAWFDIHDLEEIGENKVYEEWIKTLPVLYMQDTSRDFPDARIYPLDSVIDAFGPYFLTGSISYMMALAILRKPDFIGLWGVSDCPEYAHQRPSILFFIQRANDLGISIVAPEELIKTPVLYGYGDIERK